jgi:hypothetical protein
MSPSDILHCYAVLVIAVSGLLAFDILLLLAFDILVRGFETYSL